MRYKETQDRREHRKFNKLVFNKYFSMLSLFAHKYLNNFAHKFCL